MSIEDRRNMPIGIFDSGVGGLTVVKEIMRQLPDEPLVYFGDTARVPYGSKSKDVVIRYCRQIVNFLLTKEVKAIVIACNTASAQALEVIKEETDIPVIGVVTPGARAAVQATTSHKIGVIGTEGTINSRMYSRVINEMDPQAEVTGKACPLFVPLVEEGFTKHHLSDEVIEYYLTSMKESDFDTMILGCTHYPLLRSQIKAFMGEGVTIVNPAYETAMDLKQLLLEHGMEHGKSEQPTAYSFYVSDAADKFRSFANSILPCDIETTRQINIEDY